MSDVSPTIIEKTDRHAKNGLPSHTEQLIRKSPHSSSAHIPLSPPSTRRPKPRKVIGSIIGIAAVRKADKLKEIDQKRRHSAVRQRLAGDAV
jgi:hypothetical protein